MSPEQPSPVYHGAADASTSSSGRRFFIIDEEHLRDWLLEHSPELRRDTERMADLIRELVRHEREKCGLDNPRGTLELSPNKKKKDPQDPDLIGSGYVRGQYYRAAAWLSAKDKLKIALLPQH